MKRLIHGLGLATICFGITCLVSSSGASEGRSGTASSDWNLVRSWPTVAAEEKLTIKKIMKLAHKSGLLKKVATGKSTPEETAQLLEYYTAMPDLQPPQGSAESWQEKTSALIVAAQAAADSDPDAGNLLKTAANCSSCHDVHK